MSAKFARVSNIEIFESMYAKTPYHRKEDVFEGREILKENSRNGLCPHLHCDESVSLIDEMACSQEEFSFSVRICR